MADLTHAIDAIESGAGDVQHVVLVDDQGAATLICRALPGVVEPAIDTLGGKVGFVQRFEADDGGRQRRGAQDAGVGVAEQQLAGGEVFPKGGC